MIPIYPVTPEIVASERKMSLIVKITEKCNFKCSFCSSSNITDDKHATLDMVKIKQFLLRYPNTSTIIVNGGDPLMVPIQYYWELLAFMEEHGLKAILSFTSNLWPFKVNPDKWTPLFLHPQVEVMTSFHYGENRLKHDGSVFTETEFWEISDLMLERVGYRPDFISVIDHHNYDRALNNVRLAKEMDVECKLNLAFVSGEQKDMVTQAMMFDLYLKIREEGLEHWEHNTRSMLNTKYGDVHICPLARNCDSGIRALQPSGDYYSCGSFGDDRKYPISFEGEIHQGQFYQPLQEQDDINTMNDWCYGCDLFNLCNGCRKTISDHKQMGLNVSHCEHMKAMEGRLLKTMKDWVKKES